MAMQLEDIKEGVYVRWIATRYMKTWDIKGKIVHTAPNPSENFPKALHVTILGFDDMKENTVSDVTVREECSIVSREAALSEYRGRITSKKIAILNLEHNLNEARLELAQWEEKVTSL